MPPKKTPAKSGPIRIESSARCEVEIPIVGLTPLIMHRQGSKAAKMMFDKQRGRKPPKEAKNPVERALDCVYLRDLKDSLEAVDIEGKVIHDYDDELYELMPIWLRFTKKKNAGFGFPSTAFHQAAIRAGKLRGMVMTDLRASFTTPEIMVKIESENEPQVRFDWVRVQQSTDLRFRPQFADWTASLRFSYLDGVIAPESIAALVNDAGSAVGVGEWRPEKNGPYGRFEVDRSKKIVTRVVK